MLLLKGVQIFSCKSNEVKWTQMELFTHPWLQRLTREESTRKVMSVGLKVGDSTKMYCLREITLLN